MEGEENQRFFRDEAAASPVAVSFSRMIHGKSSGQTGGWNSAASFLPIPAGRERVRSISDVVPVADLDDAGVLDAAGVEAIRAGPKTGKSACRMK